MRRSCSIASFLAAGLWAIGVGPRMAQAWLDPAAPDVQTVLCSEDNQFSWYNGPDDQQEWLLNFGASRSVRLKGHQDITALKFDLAAWRGRTIAEAELHLAKADTIPIFAMVAATIHSDWSEGTGSGEEAGVGESCWRWRRRPADPDNPGPDAEWTFAHGDFSTASFGNYGSLVSYGHKASGTFGAYSSAGYAWLRMKLDPAVVHALILDQAGLAVTDPRGYNGSYNPKVYAKEQNNTVRPRLLIRFAAESDTTPPGAVGSLSVVAGPKDGEAVVSFAAPADPDEATAFGYTVRCSLVDDFNGATNVDRWRIPRPASPGAAQKLLIEGLTPGSDYHFFVQAYDRAGNGGPVAGSAFALPAARPAPTLPDGPLDIPSPEGKSVQTVPGVLRHWACSEVIKVNPATGARMEDGYAGSGSDDYKKANVVWNAETNTIALCAARNEIVGCQLVLERLGPALTNVRVTASDLSGPGGATIPADPCMEWFVLHYVMKDSAYYPDAAIPLFAPFPATFSIPEANHNPAGANQSVWLDLYAPKDAVPGEYQGLVSVNAQELVSPISIHLRVRISPVVIPDLPTFLVDLNGYGPKWDYGNVDLTRLRYFQACHKHRMSLNILPYGWSAAVDADRAPVLTGVGPNVHAADWAEFDSHYGAFFDGSAFRPQTLGSPYIGPGANTPVSTFYTTFFESWPIHALDPTYGFDASGLGGAYWNNLIDTTPDAFWTDAPDVRAAFGEGYKQGVRNIVKEWFEHAQAKGWSQTYFQVYLNHKYDYGNCASLWVLEECSTADDFRAVGFFHSLYHEGAALANAPDVKWHWRLDISDRWGQNYGQVDNRINWFVMNVGSSDWHWPNLRYRNVALGGAGERWAWYGTGPAPEERGDLHMRRFLQSWAQGLDGGLPYWDNFQTNWTNSQPLSLVYSGQNVPGFGLFEGPIMSVRVKMMRQAQQTIELANLLAAQSGWSRERVAEAVFSKYGDGGWSRSFAGLGEVEIHRLRADLLAAVEPFFQTTSKARERSAMRY